MKSQKFTIGLIQMKCAAESAFNLDHAVARIEEAAKRGADIICLPELFLSHYFCQSTDLNLFDLAESIPGPTTERLGLLARTLGKVIVASIFERRAPGIYHNTAVIFDADGTMLGIYRKMHIPDDPLYHEKYYFTPGDLGFRTFDTRFGRIGVLVCWDQWFPEAARLTALQGAQVLFYPDCKSAGIRAKRRNSASSNIKPGKRSNDHTPSPTGVYVAAVNRSGHEGPLDAGIEFWGQSFISDPFGVVLSKGSHDQEEIVLAECDPARSEDVRRNWPFLRDRRIDAYGSITKRWKRDTFRIPVASSLPWQLS